MRPVPVAPAVPTVAIFALSDSTVIVSPAVRPVTLATLTLVAPAAAAADSVVLRPCVPTAVTVTLVSPLESSFWPTAKPVDARRP